MKFKAYLHLATIILLATALSACKETEIETAPLASINVTNVVNGGETLTLNTSALTVANGAFANWGLNAGQSQVKLFTNTTPSVVYYDQTFTSQNGEYYSLFLGGASPDAIDVVFSKDHYTNYTDSLFGVRFVNLLPGGPAISVNLTGAINGTEVSSLAYKSISEMKTFNGDGKSEHTTYMFEIRNASTGELLLSYGFRPTAVSPLPANPIPRFHNVSLVLKGTVEAPSILRVNHY